MANKRQRKKAAKMAANYNYAAKKKLGRFEGQQYKGGRVKGRGNLTTLKNGNIINAEGVMFTKEDVAKMNNLANRVNRKRGRMIEESDPLPLKNKGRDMGATLRDLRLMNKENEFILARRSKSLQRFTSRGQFDNYINSLEKALSPNYVTERIRAYKRNFMNSLLDVYGDEAKDIIMKVRMMKPEEYMKLVESDEVLEIRYAPSDKYLDGRLNELRAALGMKIKNDNWQNEEYF